MVGALEAPRNSDAAVAGSESPTAVANTTIRPSWNGVAGISYDRSGAALASASQPLR